MFQNKEIINFIQKAKIEQKNIVYINVLETQGAAYRKAGASMVVTSDGIFIGVVSGGCFEEDIVHCAKDVLSKNVGKYVIHDLRIKDNSLENWGQGIGCNGLIKLWMEPFYYEDNYGSLGLALEYALKGEKKTLIRSIDDSRKYSFMNTSYKKDTFYDESNNIFLQNILSPFKLLILGAGPGSESLLKIANILGWQTSIYDTKESSLKHIFSADEKILLSSSNVKTININSFDAAVVMSHDFNSDKVYLEELVFSKISYIGIMGPKKRTKIILSTINNITKAKSLNTRLYNPIGLNLGGENPESIALSICAEIESRRNKKNPISLRDTE
jgi:xanthine dehydrogenase accessory factor